MVTLKEDTVPKTTQSIIAILAYGSLCFTLGYIIGLIG